MIITNYQIMSIDPINAYEFDTVSTQLRDFFKQKNLQEVPVQHRLSILAACEDPTTVAEFQYNGTNWPLPQTGQMQLEYEILTKSPAHEGYFCYSTSYRQEKNPVLGRHNLIFPMFEFELKGDVVRLQEFERELLEHLGFGGKNKFPSGKYIEIAKQYNVKEISHKEEQQLYSDYGPVFFLQDFPLYTSPFWNMSVDLQNQVANKIDVILSGMETIGSAERSSDPETMREMFHAISDGQYAKLLYDKFGKERVEKELEEFLAHDFKPRCGGGIGITRLIRAMKLENLL